MKRFNKTMRMVVAMMSLCLVFVLGITSEAAQARFKTGAVYIFPDYNSSEKDECPTNSKNEYYSTTKYRMSTYDDMNLNVVYPKDATFEVKSNKKAFEASVIEKSNEDITGEEYKKVYVTPNAKYVGRVLFADGTKYVYYDMTNKKYYSDYTYYDNPMAVSVYAYYIDEYGGDYTGTIWQDVATGKYYEDYSYNSDTNQYELTYPVTVERVRVYGKYIDEYDDTYIGNFWVDNAGKYYESAWSDTPVTMIEIVDDSSKYYLVYDASGAIDNSYHLNKTDNGFYYYYDQDVTVYINNRSETYDDGGVTPDYEYAVATVKLTSTKAGTYKVTFTINGAKTTVQVLVNKNGGRLYSKAKLGSATLSSFTKKDTTKNTTTTSTQKYEVKKNLKSAKLKFTANKNIKITGMIVASVDKNGKAVYKKVKNGGKIQLSQEYTNNTRYGVLGSKSRSKVKNTYVCISYKDTFLKTSCTYSIVTKHGEKQIKEVYKDIDGTKYTYYHDYGYGDLNLWSY